MHELIQYRERNYRLQLLATVSAIVLAGSGAHASDSKPLVWIDAGWHTEGISDGGQDEFTSPFFGAVVDGGFASPAKALSSLSWSSGAEGKISFEPAESNWLFSVAVRYGRSNGHKHVHEQTPGGPVTVHLGTFFSGVVTPFGRNFADTAASTNESHVILDFQAGREVGLGLFGSGSTSVVSAGVRYGEFTWGSQSEIRARPDKYYPTNQKYPDHQHVYSAHNVEKRSFHGWGPILSWDASARLAGNSESSDLALNWGVNVGVLFGRQKSSGQHQTKSAYYRSGIFVGVNHYYYQTSKAHDRSRSVAVPNVGGFAGLSLNWSNAKVAVGYRVDWYGGAMDTGIDARKSSDMLLHGPFATISVGLGG